MSRARAHRSPARTARTALMALAALTFGLAVAGLPAAALADPTTQCAADSLDTKLALQRLEWARKCGLIANSNGASSWFASTRAFDAASFPAVIVGAKEYREVNPNRSFSGNSNAYDINFSYAFYRYEGPLLYTVTLESSGPTSGYYKWSGATQRSQPLYPSFGSVVTGTGVLLLPLPTVYNDCNLYQWDPIAGTLTRWTSNHYVVAYCPSSP